MRFPSKAQVFKETIDKIGLVFSSKEHLKLQDQDEETKQRWMHLNFVSLTSFLDLYFRKKLLLF